VLQLRNILYLYVGGTAGVLLWKMWPCKCPDHSKAPGTHAGPLLTAAQGRWRWSMLNQTDDNRTSLLHFLQFSSSCCSTQSNARAQMVACVTNSMLANTTCRQETVRTKWRCAAIYGKLHTCWHPDNNMHGFDNRDVNAFHQGRMQANTILMQASRK
jgi:hypothetical protein